MHPSSRLLDRQQASLRATPSRTGDLQVLPFSTGVLRSQPRPFSTGVYRIPAEVVGLADSLRVSLTRTQWLSLLDAGLVTLDGVRQASTERLSELLRSEAAVGQVKTAVEA
ncbi:MAG TPA: hypothetical protein VGA62_00555, partial [Acidimicrobiia bacterium]